MQRIVVCLALAMFGLIARGAAADCCCECGCQAQCCKVCRCVPDIKKVTRVCYGCECEDVCIPGPSKICGYTCECPDKCPGEGTLFLFNHPHKKPIWQPSCAKVAHRTKLVKKEETKEVKGWKWVVEDLCPKCAANAESQSQDALASGAGKSEKQPQLADRRAADAPKTAATPVSSRRSWLGLKRAEPEAAE